ncbi:hypothetical protein [Nocardia sp. NPDC050406]|uniref:hypothetical protein n=1 Tax=Nocardia sp. NPDC050406 TaxID=3364318 RepID=UPI0037A0E0AD
MDSLRRTTALAALFGAVVTLIELPLYFLYGGPPPDWNIFTRSLFGLLGLTAFVVFMNGFAYLVRRADAAYDWVGGLAATAGLMWVTVAFVSTAFEVGAAIQATEPIDPTISVSGTYILYGSTSRLLETVFFTAFGVAVLRTRLLPEWTAKSAFVMAAINIVFVPSLFFGNTPANFYAANGWGTTATVGGLTMLWLLAIGVALTRAPAPLPHAATRTSHT